MVVARRRRRRPPILAFLALAVTAVVLVAAVAKGSSKGPDPRLAWLDQVRPMVERSNQLGLELTDLRNQVGKLERPVLSRRLDRLGREARAVVSDVERVDAPPVARDGESLLISTMAVRARSIVGLRSALDTALGTGPITPAIDRLSTVGGDLLLADRTYQLFLDSLPHYRRGVTVPSQWITDAEGWQRPSLASFVASLRASASSAPVHDVSVLTVATDPAPTGNENGTQILPMAKALGMRVVVANVGNESVEHVTVLATLTAPDGSADTARQFVDLTPGQRQAVQIGGLHPVPGQPLVLSVKIGPIDGETNTSDNEQIKHVLFR